MFDPGNPHGLGTLFLDALSRVGGIETGEGMMGGGVEVEREATTEAGNSIDILIQSDSHAILIENKIFASIDNPFADYAAHLDSSAEHRDKHKFVLTLKPVGESVERAIGHGFRNITHEQLVNDIRGLLGFYVAGADTRYLTFMLDFLNTLDNLQGGTAMNLELVRFLALKRDEVDAFLGEIRKFQRELRSKVARLQELIDINDYPNVGQSLWHSGAYPLRDVLVYDITIANDLVHNVSLPFVVAVDTIVSPDGWRIELFPRHNERNPDRQAELRNLLQNLNIPFEEGERLIVWTCSQYGRDLTLIAQTVREFVLQLANAA